MRNGKDILEGHDPNIIFKEYVIDPLKDNPYFEANTTFLSDFYFENQIKAAKEELKNKKEHSNLHSSHSTERNLFHNVDPIILNKEFQELDDENFFSRSNPNLTKTSDNFNNATDLRTPYFDDRLTGHPPLDLYQSQFSSLQPEYNRPIPMSSHKYAFQAILSQDKTFIDRLSDFIQKEKRPILLSRYLSNRAFGLASLNIYQKALQDCQASISNYINNTFAFFLKGMIHLFRKDETYAINTWRTALSLEYYDHFSLLMKHLIQDHNIRHKLYTLKGNIKKIIRFIDRYKPYKIYSSDDIQIGYKKLFEESYYDALIKLQHVIHSHPHNTKALIGNAIAVFASEDYLHGTNQFLFLKSIKNIPAEYSKFLAFGHAMLRNESNAVINLSHALQSNPTDNDAILLRAKLQIQRGLYKSALKDLLMIPKHLQTDQVLVRIALCYIFLGDIPLCVKALHNAKPDYKDSYLFYVWFLLVSEQKDMQSSLKAIQNAINWDPTFNLLTTAGDFCYENGMYDESSEYYQKALEQRRNSRVILRKLAFAFIQNGREIEGLKILKNIGFVSNGGDFNYSNGQTPNFLNDGNGGSRQNSLQLRCFDHWLIDFKRIEATRPDRIDARISPFDPLSKSDNTDYRFILYLMNFRDEDFILATRDKIRDTGQNPVSFLTSRNKLLLFPPDDEEEEYEYEIEQLITKIKLIKEADTMGLKCISNGLGTNKNPRLIRAMGLAVICLASYMKNEMKKVAQIQESNQQTGYNYIISHWTEAFDKIRAILQLADLQKEVKWISSSVSLNPQSTSVTSHPEPNECFGFRSRESIGMFKPVIKLDGIFETPFTRIVNPQKNEETSKSEPIPSTSENTQSVTSKNGNDEHTTKVNQQNNTGNEMEHKKSKKKKKVKVKVMKPAPFTRPIRPFTGSPLEEQYVDSRSIPLYFIQNGCRRSPRFMHVADLALKKLAYTACNTILRNRQFIDTEFKKMSQSPEKIYRMAQCNVSHYTPIFENGVIVQSPSVNLRYLGALGYQVFVKSSNHPRQRLRYYNLIEDCWASLIKTGAFFYTKIGIEHEKKVKAAEENLRKEATSETDDSNKYFDIDLEKTKKHEAEKKEEEEKGDYSFISLMNIVNKNPYSTGPFYSETVKPTEPIDDCYYADEKLNKEKLSLMIFLIWGLHPFSLYSPELAHIFLHAYLLATNEYEIEKVDSGNEMFIEQMIDPNITNIRVALSKLMIKKTKSKISKESLDFWTYEVSISDVIELLSAKL